MRPATVTLILALVEEVISQAPTIANEFKTLFAGDAPPTPEQWAALRATVAGETYDDFVPASDLPKQ